MRFSPHLSWLFLIVLHKTAAGQQLNLSRLFYPNATLRAEHYFPAATPSGSEYALTRTSFLGFVPLQSEVQAGFSLRKKFDLRAVHTLMYGHYAQVSPALNTVTTPENGFKSLSLGVIRLQASLKDRLWVYGGGLGISESNETFFTPQPYFWGGAARMRIFGLQTQILYGSVLAYNQRIYVVPVFGINKRFNRHWRVTAVLPFTASARYTINNWLNTEIVAGLNGYSGGFRIESPEEKLLRRENYRHVKTGLALNAHLFSVLNVSLETGITGFRSLKLVNSARQRLENDPPGMTPYIGASIRYITTRSRLSSKFTRKLGIAESGLNW